MATLAPLQAKHSWQAAEEWAPPAGEDDPELLEWLREGGMEEDLARFGEDEIIVSALREVAGGDLWQRTRELEADLRQEETAAVEDFVHESAGVAELRLQIETCDAVLGVFEQLVNKCQADLGNIAAGVRHMKERADAFEVLSKNRQGAEAAVARWVEGVAIPRGLSKAIHEVDVGDPTYCQHLQALSDKLAFVAKHSTARGEMPVSCRNAAALLHRLHARAVERISAHLKSEMRQLEDDNQLLYAITLGQAGKADAQQMLSKGLYALTLGQAGAVGAMSLLRDRQQLLLRSSPLIHFLIDAPAVSVPAAAPVHVYAVFVCAMCVRAMCWRVCVCIRACMHIYIHIYAGSDQGRVA